MNDDADLLRSYVENHSEQAFAELVNRHLGLVYHAALRQTGGNVHCAQDIAQAVFVDLARKARSLVHRPLLTGWLYTSTRYAASKLARSEQRRKAREEGAHFMNDLTSGHSPSPDWNQLRGVIDDALHALSEQDREAVLLRFFEGKPFSEVGAKLSVSEDAARVRVDRALDKLRTLLSRRGVTSTAVALSAVLTSQAKASAPPGLAVKITGTALAGAAAAGGVAAAGTLWGLTQLQFGLALGVAFGGGGVVLHQQRQEGALRSELNGLRDQQAQLVNLRTRNEQRPLSNPTAPPPRIQNSSTEVFELRAELASLKDQQEAAEADKAEAVAKQKQLEAAQANLSPEQQPYAPIYRPSELDERPTPLDLVEPELSPELRQEGGTASVEFIVDSTGTTRALRLLNASNPAFGRGVIAAVSQWKFRPGVAHGKPVSTRMTSPFRMNPDGGKSAASARTKALRELTPSEVPAGASPYRDSEETPYAPVLWPNELTEQPTLLERIEPVVNPELQAQNQTTEFRATVAAIIDRTGTPRSLKVMNTSNEAFGRSVLDAVSQWKFKPGMAGGKAVSTWLTIPFRKAKEAPQAPLTVNGKEAGKNL